VRRLAFAPRPSADSLEDHQRRLEARLSGYNREQHVSGHKYSIAKMLGEEKGCLRPLPLKRLNDFQVRTATVGTDMTFRHDGTKYSLPTEYAGKRVTLKVLPYTVEAHYQGQLVYTHCRALFKGDDQYIPEHYLPLLVQKQRAIPDAKPLKEGRLPKELAEFRDLCREPDKYRQLVELMLLVPEVGLERLLSAVAMANKKKRPTLMMVRLHLDLDLRMDEPVLRKDLTEYDKLL